jgi:hypothetical protein
MTVYDAIAPEGALPSEEALLLLIARTRMSDALLAQAHALAPGVDWERFRQLAMEHGVASLAYPNLMRFPANTIPAEFMMQLKRHAIDNTRTNLGLIRELRDVVHQLKARDIDCALFKGISLSQLVYRDFSIRKCGDIDLLVRKKDFRRAKALFLSLGFRQTLSDKAELACLQSALWHEQRRLQVDLHWGIPPALLGIRSDKIMNSLSQMSIGGTSVSVFSTEDVFITLCVNAVKEYWNQLLYPYCDIHEFLQSDIRLDWQPLLRRAEALNCRRPLVAALGVVSHLFETRLPPALQQRPDPHSSAGLVSRELLRQLFDKEWSGSNIIHEGTGRHLYFFRSTDDYFHALMDQPLRRFGFRYLEFARPTAADKALVALPAALGFLYYLIRPVRLAGKHGRRLANRMIGKSPT